METKKDYFAIAEKLGKNYADTMGKAIEECVNLLGENGCGISLNGNETDYDVTIYEGNKICSLRGAYIPAKGSRNIILSLYCHGDKRMYDTSMLNTNLNPTTLLLTLAAKIENYFLPMDCVDHYMYQVEDYNGEKIVHIDGMVYWNEDHYDLVQVNGCVIPIADLMEQDLYGINEIVDNAFADCKQYQGEITEEEVPYYYNPKKCRPLTFADVNQDTPCGFYVDIV